MRQCPTRANGADTLIAHFISPPDCQSRQRRLYHKCFSCTYRNEGPTHAPPTPLPRGLTPVSPPKRPPTLDGIARDQAAPVLVPPAAVVCPSATAS